MTDKVVIPAAGLGTRLLSATKEQPKEMLPVFAQDQHGTICLKPIVQLIFDDLFDFGERQFCFVVGRGKRALEDHFTPHHDFIEYLNGKGKNTQAGELEAFYHRVRTSAILWINQPEPMGFGHAVLQAQPFIGDEPFLVHAGDTYIMSETSSILERLTSEHAKRTADATLALQEVQDTTQYGVAETTGTEKRNLTVLNVEEKPAKPRSHLAIMPLYIFNSTIFEALKSTTPDKGGEIQLTDAIQKLIETGQRVQAIKLRQDDIRLDIGTPETYWEALSISYQHASAKPVRSGETR
jgi:UTP--glucose-1-phosphate uridylyltransferase